MPSTTVAVVPVASAPSTRTAMMRASWATPVPPMPLFPRAAMIPATAVPWPLASIGSPPAPVASLPTLPSLWSCHMLAARSGWDPSTPVAGTAAATCPPVLVRHAAATPGAAGRTSADGGAKRAEVGTAAEEWPGLPQFGGFSRRPARLGANRVALGLCLVDDLLGEVAGDLLVAFELHRVLALPAGDRAQVGSVGEHLGHRNLGLDLGHAAAALHPHRPPAAAVEVADDVADGLLGHRDRRQHDRFEQHRAGLLERLLHRLGAGQL